MLSGGEFELSALRSPLSAPLLSLSSLSSNATTINKLIRPRGGPGIRAWTLRTRTAMLCRLSCAPPLLFRGEVRVSVPMLRRSLPADTHCIWPNSLNTPPQESIIPSILPVPALLRESQNLNSAGTGTKLSSAGCRYSAGISRWHIPAL